MKTLKVAVLFIAVFIHISACEKIDKNAVALEVDFSWGDMKECGSGNPDVKFSGVPPQTKYIRFEMYDHVYSMDHGTEVIPYGGVNEFEQGLFPEIIGPCPTSEPGRYEITIKALDEKKVVIGVGSKQRPFPEKS